MKTIFKMTVVILVLSMLTQIIPCSAAEEKNKNYMHVSFDDVYSCLQEITKNQYASVFEHPFFGDLKAMHDQYGAVFTLNCFVKGDDGYDIAHSLTRIKPSFQTIPTG